MASFGFRISDIRMKNMKCPAYAKTGLVMETKAFTNVGCRKREVVRGERGFRPAPTIPMMPATRMEITLGTESQESLSRVRGKLKMRVGIVKMPV